MAPRSKSPNRRQRKREQRQREDSIEWGNDEMSHNRLDSFQRSDFDYFREIQPKLHELKIAGAAVQCEGKKVEEAIGKIVECLQQHGDAVSVVGDSFEREHEREKEAEELKITIRQLRRMKDEESTERDNEIIELRKSATAGQRKEEELKGQQSQLESDYNKKLEDLRIAEEVNKKAMEKTFQQKLEQEIQRKIGVHSSKVEMLERQVIDLQKDNSQLRKETESLAKTLEEKELALEGLRGRNERLKTKLKECQDDFAEGEQDEKYYQTHFDAIETKVRGFVSARFGDVSERTFHKFQTISEQLIKNAPIFENTPYSNTSCSVLLRSAKAQHVILETICSSIWQPIYSEALVNPNTQGLLNGIYSTLARRGTQWQSIWRLLSVESMDRLTNSRNSNVTSLAEDVLRKLEPLVPRQLEATLKEELEDILKDAAKVWSIAQKDRNLIEIDFVPNPDDGQGWVKDSILRDYVPELEEPLPNLVNSGHVFTFPKVIRYAYHKDPMAGGKSKGSPALVIHQGSAIFSNSDILREAAKECKDQEQEMINASIKATTKTRSPSTTLSQDPALLRERIRKNKANREPLQNGTQ